MLGIVLVMSLVLPIFVVFFLLIMLSVCLFNLIINRSRVLGWDGIFSILRVLSLMGVLGVRPRSVPHYFVVPEVEQVGVIFVVAGRYVKVGLLFPLCHSTPGLLNEGSLLLVAVVLEGLVRPYVHAVIDEGAEGLFRR